MHDDYLQIVAQDLETKDEVVSANGNVLVYSQNYYITANKLIYDKKSSKLELFGDVHVVKNDETISFSQYLFVDVKKDTKNIKPVLMVDRQSKLWFNSTNTENISDNYELGSTTLSSCDCKDPAWSIGFTSGDYNTTKQWINTYNTTLYINDYPVLYTPYFGFTTNKTRRTGLLKPTFGINKGEGILYAQPLYYAPQLNYDFEYIPQIRTSRGYGHAFKYRYADSLYSTLKFETAMFKEKVSYRDDKNLVNQKHYGWDLEYRRSNLFSHMENGNSDGLILKSLDMNDVDYINTKYDTKISDYTDKFLESKLKYFYNTNSYYGDVDIRLYNDISKDNSDDVMQQIPKINLHKYTDSLFFNNLSATVDVDYSRETREVGIGADTTQISIPISYHTYLLNDYLNFKFTEKIDFTNIKYSNVDSFKNGNYLRGDHVLTLYTDLVKPYDSFIHSLNFNTEYTIPNNIEKSGDLYGITTTNNQLILFPIIKSNKNIKIGLNQSFYDRMTLQQIVEHKLNQLYVFNDTTNRFEAYNLENDLFYFHNYGTLGNRLVYSNEFNKLISSSTTLTFQNDGYFFNAYHTMLRDTNSATLDATRSITYDFGFDFNKYYKASYKEEYDLTQNISKKREYIFNIDKKCWSLNFKLMDSLVASQTTTDTALRQNILYIEFNLKQLFMMSQNYKFKERSE
jgi:LPS-assembly protein